MKPAIRVEGLSKSYTLGSGPVGQYRTLRDSIATAASVPWRRLQAWRGGADDAPGDPATLWALDNVSFDVRPGEVVGIIGHNGAGKSTLLKVLSRITEPTAGRVELRGRVGSLLEVGTGFHPELSGRENIFLCGTILGMGRDEIADQYDAIVAFAGVESFLETPVKRYSSGMYVRLAFAVAAHLRAEILIIDEVLAVGDAEFQKKCLGQIDRVVAAGRTVLFVSHNMASVLSLCPRAILMRRGRNVMDGEADEVVQEYHRSLAAAAGDPFGTNLERDGGGEARMVAGRMIDDQGRPVTHPIAGQPVTFELDYRNRGGIETADLAVTIYNNLGVPVTNFNTSHAANRTTRLGAAGTFACRVPRLPLPVGHYRVAAAIHSDGKNLDWVPNAFGFEVQGSTFFGTGQTPSLAYCSCLVEHQWDHRA